MSLLRVMYMSAAKFDAAQPDSLVQQIVDAATIANAAMAITGALLFDGRRFVQVLDGPEPALSSLIDRISVDRRHHRVVFLKRKRVDRRLFPDFSLAYSGDSVFVTRSMDRLLADHDRLSAAAVQHLVQVMQEFAA
jgi:hypothetical protein